MWCLVTMLLLACREETVVTPPPTPQPTTPPSTMPISVSGDITSMNCASTDNALRIRCTVTTAQSAVVEVVLTGPTVRRFATEVGTEHEVVLWGLRPDSTYALMATIDGGEATGEVYTQPLEGGIGGLGFEVDGDRDAGPILSTFHCGDQRGAVLVDEDAEVIAYTVVDGGDLLAVGRDGSAGFVGIVENHTVIREGFDGSRRLSVRLVNAAPFGTQLHHDVTVDDEGRIWVIEAHLADERVVDGLLVLDGDGEVIATWAIEDHITPVSAGEESGYWRTAFPLVADWSHANAIVVQDGVAILSLRHLSTLLALDAGSEPIGEVLWALSGTAVPDVESDFVWSDGGGFEGQHQGSFDDNGRLVTFDNGPAEVPSRVVAFDLDFSQGRVSEAWSWAFDQHCMILGGAVPTASGIVATCGTAPEYVRIAVGATEPSYRRRMTCDGQRHPSVPRFIPVTL